MTADDNNQELGILEFDENLNDVEKPKDIPPGRYVGEVQSVQENQSGRGNTYYAVQFRISPDRLPADIAEQYEDGAVMFWNRILKPRNSKDRRAMFNLRKFVEALGMDSNTSSIDPNDWMGREATLHVVTGRYQGEDRAEIRAIEAAEKKAPAAKRGAQASGGRRARA